MGPGMVVKSRFRRPPLAKAVNSIPSYGDVVLFRQDLAEQQALGAG